MMIKLPIIVYKVTMLPYYDYNNDDSSDKIICFPSYRSKRIKESSTLNLCILNDTWSESVKHVMFIRDIAEFKR